LSRFLVSPIGVIVTLSWPPEEVGSVDRRQMIRAGGGLAVGLAVAVSPRGAAAVQTGKAAPDWGALARGLDGRLVRPGDADYASARRLYNTRFDGVRPAAIGYISGVADIQECLDFARRAGIPVSVRNGGHSYAGYSTGKGHLVIDVSRLNAVTASGTRASVGAGAKLIDVYTRLAAHGRTVPGGSCPTVGISGLTLGGGHGILSRAYGLTCDSLTAAEVVTPDGRHLTVSGTSHADLFWALRGAGGGQFGVVTGLRFRTHAEPRVVTGYLTWSWRHAAALVSAWQDWGPRQPDEIWSALHLDKSATGEPRISVSVVGLTSRADVANAVDRLADKAGASASGVSLRSRTYLEATRAYAGCASLSTGECHLPGSLPGRSPNGKLARETYRARSDFYDRTLPAAGIRTLLARVEAVRSGSGSVALTALGGAVNRVAPTATAFVHRRSRFLAQYIETPGGATGWLDGLHTAMRRYASGGAYQNYTDPQLTDWRTAYYGANAPRLASLKHRYDPDRLLRFAQAL
jgi:FAD/FMN-containing dehydrogenase